MNVGSNSKSFIILIMALIISRIAFPHSGGLDSQGGHFNRKTGEYHSHPATEKSGKESTPAHQSAPKDLNEYFRQHNHGVIYYKGGTTKRNVSQNTKDAVKQRDNYQCTLCKSTEQLEVDHARALMNGGNNEIDNLFTLCDLYHTAKTRMDNSLRRKRISTVRPNTLIQSRKNIS